MYTPEFDEGERQLVVLSLALCSLLRPGFDWALGEIAEKLHARPMYEEMARLNQDRVKPESL